MKIENIKYKKIKDASYGDFFFTIEQIKKLNKIHLSRK